MVMRAAGRTNFSSLAPASISVTASPFTYTNASTGLQQVVVSGGTVSLVQIQRAATPISVGLLAGSFILAPGDQAVVTYTVAPTMTAVQLIA
jgi:hypothetical protein